MHAEQIRIESDSAGFELHIDTTEDGTFVFNIHGLAPQLYDLVKAEIGPWLAEGEAARHSVNVDHYPEESEQWPGESGMDYYKRTGNMESLEFVREQADHARKAAKESP